MGYHIHLIEWQKSETMTIPGAGKDLEHHSLLLGIQNDTATEDSV